MQASSVGTSQPEATKIGQIVHSHIPTCKMCLHMCLHVCYKHSQVLVSTFLQLPKISLSLSLCHNLQIKRYG